MWIFFVEDVGSIFPFFSSPSGLGESIGNIQFFFPVEAKPNVVVDDHSYRYQRWFADGLDIYPAGFHVMRPQKKPGDIG